MSSVAVQLNTTKELDGICSPRLRRIITDEHRAALEAGFGPLTVGYSKGESAMMDSACRDLKAAGIEYRLVTSWDGVQIWRKNMKFALP